ncbi:SpvB/TcaC N-terminal domain-containing protein [Saccharothrix variisporea]|uniref:Intein/RHS repeat-associated protein n=1 Tax=Saccharothrix variisporea TaxID=543527 RepID=A0A495X6A4_9PSEU|nr:SpvB/TcaC N-terminal domain-containing protein [Saccharothrix variisporea]RKT67028.1 intein/RHS repeat-associated protein [Saccharothrix variisporea]
MSVGNRRRPIPRGRAGGVLLVVLALIGFGLTPPELYGGRVRPASTGDGSVTTPDHPEGAAFNPNQLKGIKAADPTAGVNLVSAPTANNMGDARLSYPLEVPPGRSGMQPKLAVQYNSAGGNGWTGVGWDLAQAQITLDTRWGVPRYHGQLETESYLLNGEQLTPVAHRGELQARTAEKVFHTRVEGRFDKIVRHGDHPTNYWWEVTDREGTKSTFGNDPNSTLKDGSGNIATWALRETRDTNGNFVRYHSTKVEDNGVANGSVPGSNLYLVKITYTGHGDTEGRYSVTFQRDRDRNEPRRADVQIDARSGFKRVTADLLRRVEVKVDNTLIRAYELDYRPGAFAKTLLASVSQFDANNAKFNTHTFDYFDDIRDANGAYNAFDTAGTWDIGNDDLGVNVRDGEASALSATTNKSAGGHLYVGYNPTSVSKSNSAGVKVGYNSGSADGLLALADVNGDNLPDKVFRSGGGVFYRPNESGPDGPTKFGDTPIRLTNLPGISTEKTRSGTVGIESYFGVAAQLDYVSTTTTSDRYFLDVNGDGITDLVNNGGVLFGHLDANGQPAYSADSGDTGVPVGTGTASGTIVGDQTAEFQRQVDTFPLLDGVRRWVAPFDGTVRVDGRVKLLQDTSPERQSYRSADGVRVTIQHQDTELWAQRIGPDDHIEFAPTGTDNIAVRKGEALFFRVQSVLDGMYDTVSWDPKVTYTSVPASTDVNGLANDTYLASRDFTLGGRPSVVTAPLTGTLHLSGDVTKTGPTTDDVTVVVSRNGTDVYSHTLNRGSDGTASIDLDIPVTANDTLSWRLKVDSPIDAGTLRWVPRAHYTSAQGLDSVVDDKGNPVLVINPPYDLDMYPVSTLSAPQASYTATQTGTITVDPALAFDFAGQTPNTRVVFTVKKRGALLAKRVIDIVNGQVPADLRVTAQVNQGDELFFDFATLDTGLPGRLTSQSASVSYDGTNFVAVPSALHASAEQGAFAQPYRGWGAIGYQGNRDRATQPIKRSDLVLDESYKNDLPGGPTEADVPGFTNDPKVKQPRITVFAPLPAQDRWAGADDNTWVARDTSSSSRLGLDTIDVISDGDVAGAAAVSRRGRTQQISTTFGASIPGVPIGAGASVAKGRTTGQLDFLDLNGDRFPDVVGSAGVQYSDMTGGLGDQRGSVGGAVRESESLAYGVNANAGSPARTSGNARGQDAPSGSRNANSAKAGVEMPALGVGGNVGGGESDTGYDLLDINGDGLPDKVFDNGDAALNLGYSFAAREPWPGGPVNDGKTTNAGVNLGFNTNYYGFAGGVSAAVGSSVTSATLLDVNGDGLADRVFANGDNPVGVAINTGNGFGAPTPFRGSGGEIGKDENATLGGGVYFTFGFCFFFGCLVFNPGGDVSTGIGRAEVALRDVNGDGYADHVRSTRDDEFVVAANKTGRTNLLRTVSRPLGAKIDLDYTRSGNTSDQPDSKWVLSRSAVFDGHPGDGQDVQLSTYRYEGGKYDRLEREFLGYGKVVAEQRDAGAGDAVLRTLTNEYRTDTVYARGLVTRSVTADAAGRLFQETVNTYQLRDVNGGGTANPASTTATVFPLLARVDKHFHEGQANPGKSTYTEMAYDDYGNLIRSFDAADAGPGDDVEAEFGYTASIAACRDRNIVGVANLVRESGTSPRTLMRHRESTVDCTSGDVKVVKEILPDGSAAVSDLTYHPNGNLRTITGPTNKNGQRYKQEYDYDTVVGVHVERIKDSFGYESTATHDIRFGLPDLTIDENHQSLRTSYDSVGRVDEMVGPYELGSGRATIDFEYHPEASVPYAVTRHLDRTATGVRDDTIDTIQFADGLARPVQSKQDGTVATVAGAAPADVMVVSGRVTFDPLGRVVEQYYPVTEPKGAANTSFNPAYDTVAPTKLSFDVMDRSVKSVLPDGTSSQLSYGFGVDRSGTTRFETVATDANGKQRRTYTDVRVLTTSVKEVNAGTPIWTSYGYDPMGQLTSVVDDKGNTAKAEYDNFGRRTVVDSPDSGRTETRYDLAGNKTAKITAKLREAGKAVEYDYEYNRLAGIRYPVFTGNNVTYTYGGPGAPDNGADRVVAVRDAAGTVTRKYGALGEKTSETRTVTALVTPARTYTTQYRYDSFNRVLDMTYPDGEVLRYEYDSGGQVNRATGRKAGFDYPYLARMDYDKFGQRLVQETGTGVRTTFAYDPEDRALSNLKSKLADGHQFQDITYEYDNVGNVRSLTNTVPLPHGKPIGGPSKQTYRYDDLYRLTSATGEYKDKDNKLDRYSMTLAYDSIHNLTSKSQRHEILVQSGTSSLSSAESSGSSQTLADEPVTDPATGEPLPPLGAIEPEDQQVSAETTSSGSGTSGTAYTPIAYSVQEATTAQEQKKTTYDYTYSYDSPKPHAATGIGPINESYDPNGNLVDSVNTLPPAPGKRRQLVWDEENRLACNQDHSRNKTVAQHPDTCTSPQQPATVRYVYDDEGNRVVKNAGPQHIYPNRAFSERNGTSFKHVFVGDTRIATKTVKTDSTYENHHFYFHADHLGSSGYVTDEHGNLTEHTEYFAFGEPWVQEHPAQPTPVPYLYGSKELDEETGFYYYGARYYNPRTQLWQSPDPILESYLDGAPGGGVYQPFNLASYTYSRNNPVKYTDPDGRYVESAWDAISLGIGVASFVQNVREGNGWGAALDAVGIVADGAALVLPVVPGGAGALIKAGRAAEKGVEVVKAADRARDAERALQGARAADKGGDAAKAARNTSVPCAVPNSFTPDTPVLMADGSRKPISEVQVGDLVLATDPETGASEARPVTDLIVGDGSKDLVEITVDTGSGKGTVIATDGHPFWSVDLNSWVEAGQVEVGALLRTGSGTYVQVVAVRAWTQQQRVHNLTVDGLHTYFVAVGAVDVLVHNCGGPVIRNKHLAGKTHPKTGVPFDKNGFPDFSKWRHPKVPDVRIKLTGNRKLDEKLANEAAGLKSTPKDYTWHHHQDSGRMQLIRQDVHSATGHTGGHALKTHE